ADGKVYIGSGYPDKNLYCLDSQDGSFIWSYTTGDEVRSSPVIADGKVYVGSGYKDKKVYCFGSPSDHDVSVTIINSPVSGTAGVITPKVTVKNYGLSSETDVPVNMQITKIGDPIVEYNKTVHIDIGAGTTKVVTFPDWTPDDLQYGISGFINYTVTACTQMIGDEKSWNDHKTKGITLEFFRDVGVISIDSPVNGTAGVITPEVTVENFGTNNETNMPVNMVITKIGNLTVEYNETVHVDIDVGESQTATFPDWTPDDLNVAQGSIDYTVTACTQMLGDEKPWNDCKTKGIT
ncbi:unnamed protein product, partial [marine sediment metagenome]